MSRKKIVNRFGAGLLASAMIAAGAISAGLSPAVAFAANGTVTVVQKDNTQTPYTYDAFPIAFGDVHKDGTDYKATHLAWASPEIAQVVRSFLQSYDEDGVAGSDYDSWLADKYGINLDQVSYAQRDNVQNAVEFIAAEIDASAEAAGSNTDPETKQGNSFAARLSREIYAAGGITSTDVTQGTSASLNQGYWLITSEPTAIANGEAGSAPMFVPVSDDPLNITEKTDVPTISKTVKGDDADENAFQKIADAGAGEAANVDFKVASTLPTNIDAFSSYRASVADTLPAGMALKDDDTSSVKVELAGVDITDDLTGANGSIVYAGNVLTVTINNVKDSANLSDANVLADKNLVITYKAHLNGSSTIGSAGNDNTAVLTYDADPNYANVRKTIESAAKTVTYQATLTKLDKATRLPLAGAKFTCKTNIGGTDYYLKANGELTATAAEAYEFTSGPNGQLVLPRLDEGTYVIHETVAPDSYELMDADITLVIDATKDGSAGTLTALSASVTGGEGMTAGIVNAATADGITSTTVATGDVSLAVSDDMVILLPLTGLKVRDAALIGGVIIAGASIAVMVAKKRSHEEE